MYHVWGREEVITLWWEKLSQRDYLKDLRVDRRILNLIFKKWDKWSTNWIDLAQDRERFRSLVNAVINIQITKRA